MASPNHVSNKLASTSCANQPIPMPIMEAILTIKARRSTSHTITSLRLAPSVRITALASAWCNANCRTANAIAAPANNTVTTDAKPRNVRARFSARCNCGLPSRTLCTRTSDAMLSFNQSCIPLVCSGSPAISTVNRARLPALNNSDAAKSASFIMTRGAISNTFSPRSGSNSMTRVTAKSNAPNVMVSPCSKANPFFSWASTQTVPGSGVGNGAAVCGASRVVSFNAPRSG